MKIIHCSDIHLDAPLSANFSRSNAMRRRNEILLTFVKMVKYAVDNRVNAIIIAGDLFDTDTPTVETANIVKACIENNADIDFIYLQGNREGNAFLKTFTGGLPYNFKVFDRHDTALRYKETVIAHFEHPEDAPSFYEGDINIVINYGEIDPARWAGKNINYMAMGHYHKHIEGPIDQRGVYCYSGCIEGRDFDECGEKGFVVLNIKENENRVERTFVPFAMRTIHEITLDITDIYRTEIVNEEIEKLTEDIPKTDLIKVVLKGSHAVGETVNIDFLTKRYEREFFAVKVDDSSVSVDIPASDYKFDRSLKGEFSRLVMDSDMTEEEKQKVIDMGIKALAGMEV
ncbi:MAG: metallophosphoesterase [Lachnospiraceae bacterium]|nr:metallophosphoesterase [Lachnospiraceae bacterium]